MTILRYTVADDKELTNESPEYDNYAEARSAACERRGVVMQYTYQFDDSELVDDFTEPEDATGEDEPDCPACKNARLPGEGDGVQCESCTTGRVNDLNEG